jgi:hypothetical protein
MTALKCVSPSLGHNRIILIKLEQKGFVWPCLTLQVGTEQEITFFVDATLAKQKVRHSKAAGAFPEPPSVHCMQTIARLEEFDSEGHKEVVE